MAEPLVAVGGVTPHGVQVGRLGAALAVGCAVLHLALAGVHGVSAAGVLMAAVSLACLPCAGTLWRHRAPAAWAMLAVMAAAMLAAHAALLALPTTLHTLPAQGGVGSLLAAAPGGHTGHALAAAPTGAPSTEATTTGAGHGRSWLMVSATVLSVVQLVLSGVMAHGTRERKDPPRTRQSLPTLAAFRPWGSSAG